MFNLHVTHNGKAVSRMSKGTKLYALVYPFIENELYGMTYNTDSDLFQNIYLATVIYLTGSCYGKATVFT